MVTVLSVRDRDATAEKIGQRLDEEEDGRETEEEGESGLTLVCGCRLGSCRRNRGREKITAFLVHEMLLGGIHGFTWLEANPAGE